MKINNFQDNKDNYIIDLKSEEYLKDLRYAGSVVNECLKTLKQLVDEKTSLNLLELDKIAEDIIIKNNCLPTFKNYRGFPNSVCISVNNTLVHDIPNNYVLKDGDLISFDLGSTFNKSIADSAITVIYGEAKSKRHIELINATKEALLNAISSIKVGKQIGIIGYTINKTLTKYNLTPIVRYGGHSISVDYDGNAVPHGTPFVSNKSRPDIGPRIMPGLVLAIEPLATIASSPDTTIKSNNWGVNCLDLCSHHEATIFVHKDNVEIISGNI